MSMDVGDSPSVDRRNLSAAELDTTCRQFRRDQTGQRSQPEQTEQPKQSGKVETLAEDSSYFPSIRRRLEEGDDSFSARCPICCDKLMVPGLKGSECFEKKRDKKTPDFIESEFCEYGMRYEDSLDGSEDEDVWLTAEEMDDETDGELDEEMVTARISPCGHIFCLSCIRKALSAQQKQRVKRWCPMCRTPLHCRQCGKTTRFYHLPDGTASSEPPRTESCSSALTSVSSTRAPEALRYQCDFCTANDRWEERIQRGQWPDAARGLEPGVAEYVYYLMTKMARRRVRMPTKGDMIRGFCKLMDDEFGNLREARYSFMQKEQEKVVASLEL